MTPSNDKCTVWTTSTANIDTGECTSEQQVPSVTVNNPLVLPAPLDPSNESRKENVEPKVLREIMAVVFSCWINLASGTSLGYATPALTMLLQSSSILRITESEGSWMASLVMLGGMMGGFLSGFCISLGRKNTLWSTSLPLLGSWMLIYFAKTVWYLHGAHFIMGVCMGVISDASQIYVSETASRKWRGALGCVPVLMFNVGILLSYIAGAYLTWYNLAAFGAIITIPALVVPYFMPESPIYLVVKGKNEKAGVVLQWLRGSTYNISEELKELEDWNKTSAKGEKRSLLTFLKGIKNLKWHDVRDFLRPFLHTAAIRALSRFCGLRAILCYMQIIFTTTNTPIDSDVTTIATGSGQLVATFAACLLLDRLGRRKLLIISQAVMGVSLFGLGCHLYFRDDTIDTSSPLSYIPLVSILIYIIANSFGLGPVSGIIIGELVPQRYRGTVSSTTGAFSWLSAFVITKTFYDLRSCLYLHGAVWSYSAVCLVGVFYVYFLVPETRGLSQIEIETLFDRQSKKTEGGQVNKKEVPEVIVR